MADELSVGPIITAIDDLLAAIDDAGRKGLADTEEVKRATDGLHEVRERVRALCLNPEEDELWLRMIATG